MTNKKGPFLFGKVMWNKQIKMWNAEILIDRPESNIGIRDLVESRPFHDKELAIEWVDNYGDRLDDIAAFREWEDSLDFYMTDKVYLDD